MQSVVDRNVILRCMTVYCENVGRFILLPLMFANLCFLVNRTDCLIPLLTVRKWWKTHQRTVSCLQAGQYHLFQLPVCIRLESSCSDWSHILCWWIEMSTNTILYQKFEVFTAVLLISQFLWDMVQWWWMSHLLLDVLYFLKTLRTFSFSPSSIFSFSSSHQPSHPPPLIICLLLPLPPFFVFSSSSPSSPSSSIGTTAHYGLWPVKQCPSIFPYLPPTVSIFSLPALEDLFLLPLSIFSWVFPFFSSLPVLEWRSFWASYPPPFFLGDLTSLSFALLSILLYFLLCSSLLVLDSSDFHIPRLHI